ncbi:MAG: ATP-binding domain-containing protein, partial [Thermoanaerobaculia bacterium]
EVQDLSGHRAAMVLKLAHLVKRTGGAVCFLGDPAQAIYDFDNDADEVLSSTEFLENLSSGAYCGKPPKEACFENYRRFETPEMLAFVRKARDAMGADGLHPDGGQLAGLLSALAAPRTLEDLREWAHQPGTKAVLTRTNLEAYQLWTWCDRAELNADLWRGSSGSYWPGWIARLVLGFKQETMPIYRLEERWREAVGPLTRTTLSEAIEMLEREGVLADRRLDVVRLNNVIASGSPATQSKPNSAITISTVHRSKGLEFDHVLLYSPRANFAGDALEVRIVYVAATRARKHFRLLAKSDIVKGGARNSAWMNLRTRHFHVRQDNSSIGILLDGVEEADQYA